MDGLQAFPRNGFCDWGRYLLQLSLTMLMFVTLRWPCSLASLSMSCSFISSLVFSLAPRKCVLLTDNRKDFPMPEVKLYPLAEGY